MSSLFLIALITNSTILQEKMTPTNIDTQKAVELSLGNISLSSEKPKTIYEKIITIYSYDEDYNINSYTTLSPFSIEDNKEPLKFLKSIKGELTKKSILKKEFTKSGQSLALWEKKRKDDEIVGIVTENFESDEFEEWFLDLLLSTSRVDYGPPNKVNFSHYTNEVTKEFASTLKNTATTDKWNLGGEEFFKRKVDFFTSRGITIEAVLPAFPCKSSNFNKVATWKPDKGEELALSRLIFFAKQVKKIYPPGIIVYIVSDGHVFSDCIGVNDDIVDEYSKELQNLYRKLNPNEDDLIRFFSLKDIFSLNKYPLDPSVVEKVPLNHYLGTQIEEASDLCRKLLVHSCDTDAGELRKNVTTEGHPRLYLYRGFSRFMEEDLVDHPFTKDMSRKGYKKTISKIAFEMIKRNDAYSNLVEVVFPFHLRFSIHAHNNAGPKFGIRLLASSKCKVIKSLQDSFLPIFDDLLHIPTPWHNCVLKLDTEEYFYVCKSGVVKAALAQGSHLGEWSKQDGCFIVTSKNR